MYESCPATTERSLFIRLLLLLIVCLYIPLVHTLGTVFFPDAAGGVRMGVAAFAEWSLFALLFFLLRLENLKPRDIWLTREHLLRESLLGFALTLIFWLLMFLVVRYGLIAALVPGMETVLPEGYGLRFSLRLPPLTVPSAITLGLALTAGICEEGIFRGYLLARARHLFSSPAIGLVFALFLSSVFFGLLHLPMGLGTSAMALGGGFCCSVLVLWRRNLTGAMVAHILFNLQGWYLS